MKEIEVEYYSNTYCEMCNEVYQTFIEYPKCKVDFEAHNFYDIWDYDPKYCEYEDKIVVEKCDRCGFEITIDREKRKFYIKDDEITITS